MFRLVKLIWSDTADKTRCSEKFLLPSSVPSVPQLFRVCSVPDVSRRSRSSAHCCCRLHAVSARSVSTCLITITGVTVWQQWWWYLALNRYAQAPPSDSVSNLQQRFLPDPLGPGKLQRVPGESLLPCESPAEPGKRNLVSFLCFVTSAVVPSESWCESHSVSRWCILSRRQSGPQLLHGDLLP